MSLTLSKNRSRPRDPDAFPTVQLALLALVRVAEPIALTSILPYAWKLVLQFNIGDKSDASFYAGILISAFSLAECLTGMLWGGISDKVGRKPILLFVVGFSTNFWMALAGRALGGLLNGNIGVIQTMVGELVQKPEHEPKAYAVMPFVWSIGTIIGPAIGGCFSNPSENFPSTFSPDGLFARYPFLLSNLICAFLLLIAILAGIVAIEETHPDLRPGVEHEDTTANATETTPFFAAASAPDHAPADLTAASYGTFNAVDVREEERWYVKESGKLSSKPHGKVFSKRVIMLVVALGVFTYHSMTYDHLLPIFLQDQRLDHFADLSTKDALSGGLGLSIQRVGIILAFNGIIAMFIQGVIFPYMAAWMGIWRLFLMVTFGHPFAYFIVPYLVLLPPALLYPGIYLCLTVRNFFSIMAYPILLILIKEATPVPAYLGRINGLAASTGAACRTVASPIAGFLYGLGLEIGFTPLAWWSSAIVAIGGAVQVFFMRRQKDIASVKGLTHHMSKDSLMETSEGPQRQVVHITIDPIPEESESSSDGISSRSSIIEDADEETGLLQR